MKFKFLTVMSLFASVHALGASKNYGSLITATDGSTIIIGPRFQYNGINYGISENSDLNGVCKLYGFKGAVENSVTTEQGIGENDNFLEAVRISGAGTMSGFDDRSIVYNIGCVTGEVAVPSRDFAGISRSDDGSVVIRGPFYRLGSETLPLSFNSVEDGVCKLYGFGSYIEGSLQTGSAGGEGNEEGRAVVISGYGKFARINTNGTTIETIACRDNGSPIEGPAVKTEVLEMGNGKVRILHPLVNGLPISRHSKADAVCLAFGFEGGATDYTLVPVGENIELDDAGAVKITRSFGIGYTNVDCAR